MSDTVTDLAELLARADRPGDFCMSGTAELLAPALAVDGVGPISLPVLPAQAAQLIAAAERAPYGKGPDTIVDTAVRNSWQIEPKRMKIAGRRWSEALRRIVDRAAEGLGVTDPVDAEFYKLLIYETGSFFVPHRDTEKTPHMFATLVIALPSAGTGGDLVVRHKDREMRLALRSEDPGEVAYAAFYADCLHEVLPVTDGHRLTLIYNLIRKGRGKAPQPPEYGALQEKIAALLQIWQDEIVAFEDDDDRGVPEKLVYPLEHAYTAPELGFAALKGADAAAAGVLAVAAKHAGCVLHLALLTLEESGYGQYSGEYDDDDEYEIGEVTDGEMTLSNWHAWSGEPVSWGDIPVAGEELSPPEPFADMEPDELHFEEASGNAGVSFERSYRRAALVLWPEDRAFAVLTQAGVAVTVPHLTDLARRWAAEKAEAIWAQAHALSGHMIATWPKSEFWSDDETDETSRFLRALVQLRDIDRIAGYFTRVVAGGHGYDKSSNPAVLEALRLLPPDDAVALIGRTVTAHGARRSVACADLLARAIASWTGLNSAAAALLEALPRDPAPRERRNWMWGPQPASAEFVSDLLIGSGGTDPALADNAVTHILANPVIYGIDETLVPAVRGKLAAAKVRDQPAVSRLREVCLGHLRARISLPLESPADWRRPATLTCKCRHCTALSRFLDNPDQKVWAFAAVQAVRSHVASTISNSKPDVDTETLRKGSPHSLVCTKNQASYERRVAERKRDLEDEAKLAG